MLYSQALARDIHDQFRKTITIDGYHFLGTYI